MAARPDTPELARVLDCDPSKMAPFSPNAETFDRRHHAYLLAKASVLDPDLQHNDDADHSLRHSVLSLAEVLLLATPATSANQAWTKLHLLEAIATEEAAESNLSAPRTLLALASFKRDLLRLDF